MEREIDNLLMGRETYLVYAAIGILTPTQNWAYIFIYTAGSKRAALSRMV